jgi:ribosome-binding protein aMBF1 (putative translation factor)
MSATSRSKSKQAKKAARKPAKAKAKAKPARKAAKPSKPTKRSSKGPGRGIRADGKPRRKPGTNPPKSKAALVFGRRVAKLRAAKGWTQAQLAEKIGCVQSAIANIERGVSDGRRRSGAALAKALKCKALAPKKAKKS